MNSQTPDAQGSAAPTDAQRLAATLDAALERLEQARPFAKHRHQPPVLAVVGRMIAVPGGLEALDARAARMEAAGIFQGSDWDSPRTLLPQLTGQTLASADMALVALEVASLMRLLVAARGEAGPRGVPQEFARHFLTQALALNLRHFFATTTEADRQAAHPGLRRTVFRYIADHVGLEDVLGVLVDEIWRILDQRPVQTGPVKEMITQISIAMTRADVAAGRARSGAERLVAALFGPTTQCRDDPGLAVYFERLSHLDEAALMHEATGFARAMHDTGLVSDYHAAFLRWIVCETDVDVVDEALGLGPTGRECRRRWRGLVDELVAFAISERSPQAVHGLALMLERGLLHVPPIAPALRRQMTARAAPAVAERLSLAYGAELSAEVRLLAGVLEVLGQPLGVGQGANPTCQSARAIAMWSMNDPDFLLHLVAQATEFDAVLMHFEGRPIRSSELPAGLAAGAPLDADPVSVLLVPHLDRIYAEMGRLCAERGGDPHRWINPEFHGWWVPRECLVAVDVATGRLAAFDAFLTRFFQAYDPRFNGGRPVIHPQPAGVAATDSAARFVGWHAIAIQRVAEDQHGEMRVYFYNPNNDSGQDWGGGIVVSTAGCGERHGEASLPIEQFAARLYLFHDEPVHAPGVGAPVPEPILARINAMVAQSWAADRLPPDHLSLVGAEPGPEGDPGSV
ncbi:hypothetical protein P2H44_19745 [Albimonas sp. CAU 1670]|uniref:hypothetical protein n=1 Tax=Albimonas sp. CAU 1670 TaxID=3032599 RepID=UPI0023DBC4EA|nr:hypothetical protein [Albimonas sp. CAU 1670]MDF2234800.1 hypothetical protein [Albimonas sp. CAU 1670]